jgi:hypothetical protein
MNEQRFFRALASFSLGHRPLAGHAPSLSLAKDQNSSLPVAAPLATRLHFFFKRSGIANRKRAEKLGFVGVFEGFGGAEGKRGVDEGYPLITRIYFCHGRPGNANAPSVISDPFRAVITLSDRYIPNTFDEQLCEFFDFWT